MIRSNFCDHSDAYIHVKGTIAVPNTVGVSTAVNNANKKIVFKNCAPFTNCISETNNTEVDDTADIDLVMPMYNWIAYCDVYSKISGSLWQYYRNEPALDKNDNIIDFPTDNNNTSFKFKRQIIEQTGNSVNKKCWNNGTIKISKSFLKNT